MALEISVDLVIPVEEVVGQPENVEEDDKSQGENLVEEEFIQISTGIDFHGHPKPENQRRQLQISKRSLMNFME